MSTYNYERIPRKATCVQYTGDNTSECVAILTVCGASCDTQRQGWIIVRHPGVRRSNINGLRIGDWVVIGEDGEARIYSDKDFKIKYRGIND